MADRNAFLLRLAAWLAPRLPAGIRRLLYRLGPLTSAIRGGLNRAAPRGRSEVRVAAGPLRGASFMLDLHSEKDLWLGNYELELMAALSRVLAPGMTVYDIGANLGYLTVAIGRLVGSAGSVHAFEPLPENLERLRDAVGRNDLENRVLVVEAALGLRSGRARFLKHKSGGMGKLAGSAGRRAGYQEEMEVSVLTLDGYLYEQGAAAPDWIKIDVEGGEAAVLAGGRRMLREARPGLLLEVHGPEAGQGIWGELEVAGYTVETLAGRPIHSARDLDWKAYLLARPAETAGSEAGDG